VLNRATGAVDTNPYFHATAWPGSAGQWILLVGHMWPAGSGTGSFHPDSGVWNTSGIKLSGPNNEYVWQATAVKTTHRSYLYYSTDTTTNQQWYQPRIDLVDGTEPSVVDLIAGVGSEWYDLAGTNHGNIANTASLFNTSGYMDFDGVDDHVLSSSNVTYENNMTWEAWVNRTSSVNIYNMIMGAYLPYISARDVNYFVFSNRIGGVQQTINTSGTVTIVNNTWYHVAASTSYDGANTAMSLYVNGVLRSSGSFVGSQSVALASKLTVGTWYPSGTDYPFNGKIDNVKAYNRTLTSTEIAKNFEAHRGRFGI